MKTLLLAFTMNVVPVAPLDILRFLRVPAIVWVMKRTRGRTCTDAAHRLGVRRHSRRFGTR